MSSGFNKTFFTGSVLLLLSGVVPAAETPFGFIVHETARPLPTVTFKDVEGHERKLTDYRGKVVLLNVWATWCLPCRKEIPALDRLQVALGGPQFAVVAVSIDRPGPPSVRRFFNVTGVAELNLFSDESGKVLRELGGYGLPTTVLIDRGGREIGRLVGPAEWDAPEMVAFLRKHVESGPSTETLETKTLQP